jgi:two-component system, NarL family, response regulator DevR
VTQGSVDRPTSVCARAHPTRTADEVVPSAHGARLLLVDGHGLFREGLRSVLEGQGTLRVVAEAATPAEALAAVARARPQVVLTAFRLPGVEDGAIISALTRAYPELPVVVLTSVPPEESMRAALQAGAQAFLMKDTPAQLLPKAIAAALAGDIWVQREAVAQVVRHERNQETRRGGDRQVRLSPRETEVLRLLTTGASTAEIAETLFITTSTVRVHVLRILEKLGVRTRIAAVRYALRAGLAEP